MTDAIASYNKEAESDNPDNSRLDAASRLVKKYVVELGIHRELRLDSLISKPYSAGEISVLRKNICYKCASWCQISTGECQSFRLIALYLATLFVKSKKAVRYRVNSHRQYSRFQFILFV